MSYRIQLSSAPNCPTGRRPRTHKENGLHPRSIHQNVGPIAHPIDPTHSFFEKSVSPLLIFLILLAAICFAFQALTSASHAQLTYILWHNSNLGRAINSGSKSNFMVSEP